MSPLPARRASEPAPFPDSLLVGSRAIALGVTSVSLTSRPSVDRSGRGLGALQGWLIIMSLLLGFGRVVFWLLWVFRSGLVFGLAACGAEVT